MKKQVRYSSLDRYPFFLALVSIYIFSVFVSYSNLGNPPKYNEVNTIFGPVGPVFSDWLNLVQYGAIPKPYQEAITNYPPFALLVSSLINRLGSFSLLPLLFCTIILVIHPYNRILLSLRGKRFLTISKIKKISIFALLLLNYPLLFGFFRGNFDILVSVLVLLSILTTSKTRFYIYTAAAMSIKPWAVGFVFFLLARKRFKDALIVLTLTAFLTIISLFLIGYTNPFLGLYDFLGLLIKGNANMQSQAGFDFTVQFSALVRVVVVAFFATPSSIVLNFFFSKSAAIVFLVLTLLLTLLVFKISIKHEKNAGKLHQIILMFCLILPCISLPPNYAYRLAWFIPVYLLFAGSEPKSYLLPDFDHESLDKSKTSNPKYVNKNSRVYLSFKPWVVLSLLIFGTPFLTNFNIGIYGDLYALSILGIFPLMVSLRRI